MYEPQPEVLHYERGNAIRICNRIMFNFYPGVSHVQTLKSIYSYVTKKLLNKYQTLLEKILTEWISLSLPYCSSVPSLPSSLLYRSLSSPFPPSPLSATLLISLSSLSHPVPSLFPFSSLVSSLPLSPSPHFPLSPSPHFPLSPLSLSPSLPLPISPSLLSPSLPLSLSPSQRFMLPWKHTYH